MSKRDLTVQELTAEELAEAALIEDNLKAIMAAEVPRIARMLASKKNGELFGETEFRLRDILHNIGVRGLEAALEGRKKRGTKGPASSARTARKTRSSSAIDPAKSRQC